MAGEDKFCREITQKSASNLALAFILLPEEKRRAMVILYAFCRMADDIVDEESATVEERRAELNRWKEGLERIYRHEKTNIPVLDEFARVVWQYNIPFEYANELMLGVGMDLEKSEYRTYEELDLYCYRVASAVGLMSLRIFGFKHPETEQYAIALGKALQYTNILRDVKVDAEKGRIYMPSEEFEKFGVTSQDIWQSRYTEAYYNYAKHYSERALGFYKQALATLCEEDRPNMIAAELMGAVYWGLFKKLQAANFDVFSHKPVRLTKWGKIIRILRTWLRFKLGCKRPNYGK